MIVLKSEADIKKMRKAGRLAAQVLDMIEPHVKPGVSTLELDELCADYIRKHGAVAAPLNYRGFPKSICTSINEVVCHGIPSPKVRLKDGDIVNVDITTIVDGYHGDTSRTFIVGDGATPTARRLVACARDCLNLGIKAVRIGARVGDIGAAIQAHAEAQGFSVVREFVGHGIGRGFHEDPQIPHFGQGGRGARIEPGMCFTIEPMINEGHWKTKLLSDGWTAVTIDHQLSAQFEHTLAVLPSGEVEIMTLP